MTAPRAYRDATDFETLLSILVAGAHARNGTYYVHPGDVKWWLSYPDQSAQFRERITIWEAAGAVRAACLFTPAETCYDLFIRPDLRGSAEAESMEAWAEQHLSVLVRQAGGQKISVGWIAEEDRVRVASLERRGFSVGGEALYGYSQLLTELPDPELPEGFEIRPTLGEVEAESRALASHSAFQSIWPMDRYLARRLSFMRSPVFDPDKDMVVVAPDGRVAAFCIYWLDVVNRVGLFEPVGAHADFQRRGLGRALMRATLKKMRDQGMLSARVCSQVDNRAANRLYESVGFLRERRLLTYEKTVRL